MIDGGQSIRQTSGSGRTYYMSAGWQFNISGLYQLPKEFEFSGNLFGRQGYPQPYYHRIDLGAFEGRERVLAVDSVNEIRLTNLSTVDIRFARTSPSPAGAGDGGRGDLQPAQRRYARTPQSST